MNTLQFAWEHLTAGAAPLIWHWGIGIGIIIICIGLDIATFFIPIVGEYLTPLRKDLLWIAAAVALFLFAEGMGVRDEHVRNMAQQKVLLNQVDRVVSQVLAEPDVQPQPATHTKKGVFRNKVVKRQAPRDKWDQPGN